jgi:urea transport system permease protein
MLDPGAWLVVALLAALTVGLPLFGAALPVYLVNAIGQVLAFGLLALSLDLLWGYAGILSLGQGLFFAMGGYLIAMHLLRAAYAQTRQLPDFLVFMGQRDFPGWWGFADSPLLTLLAIIAVPALVALAFGYVSFRSRVRGVYFSIITQALVYTAMLLMFRNDSGFGGNNGMTGFRTLLGLPLGGQQAAVALAAAAAAVLLAAFLGLRWLLAGRFGRLLVAIRDDEARLRFLGYETLWLKLGAWCLAASLAALAGALYVPQVGIINPALLAPDLSLEIAVWVAIGGRGRLTGALLGAGLVNLVKFWLSAYAPQYWPFVLALFVLLVVTALPNGLLDLRDRCRRWMAMP